MSSAERGRREARPEELPSNCRTDTKKSAPSDTVHQRDVQVIGLDPARTLPKKAPDRLVVGPAVLRTSHPPHSFGKLYSSHARLPADPTTGRIRRNRSKSAPTTAPPAILGDRCLFLSHFCIGPYGPRKASVLIARFPRPAPPQSSLASLLHQGKKRADRVEMCFSPRSNSLLSLFAPANGRCTTQQGAGSPPLASRHLNAPGREAPNSGSRLQLRSPRRDTSRVRFRTRYRRRHPRGPHAPPCRRRAHRVPRGTSLRSA